MTTDPTILYISHDGMLEPLGQSQVLAYLEQLSADYCIHLVSFEKPADRADVGKVEALKARIKAANIEWHPLTYHKSPRVVATAWDIVVGAITAIRLARRHKCKIVHARSYVPALMALGVKRATGAKFLFDIRGFWPDERVDGGLWPRDGRLYRMTKRLEERFFRAADHVVTLTNASVEVISGFDYLQEHCPPISVIPTCADLERFRPVSANSRVEEQRPFTFGYVGSVGTWYLFDETLAFFKEISKHKPDACLLVVNRNEHAFIRGAVEKAGIAPERLHLVAADHQHVPPFIAQMDVAAAIIRPCYSKISSAPTKLGEYLGCGVPCIGNVGVGDMEEILEGERVGIALRDFSTADLAAGAKRLLDLLEEPGLKDRCVNIAHKRFSLEGGVEAYREIYERLTLIGGFASIKKETIRK